MEGLLIICLIINHFYRDKGRISYVTSTNSFHKTEISPIQLHSESINEELIIFNQHFSTSSASNPRISTIGTSPDVRNQNGDRNQILVNLEDSIKNLELEHDFLQPSLKKESVEGVILSDEKEPLPSEELKESLQLQIDATYLKEDEYVQFLV